VSGYGGQPPGWNDPNDPNPYNPDPYGQAKGWNDPNGPNTQPGWDVPGQPGAPPPYGYGPPGVSRQGTGTPGSTIAALICTSVATALCCNILAIPGIVTSAIAMSRSQTDPKSTRTLTTWSWIILAVAIVLEIAFIVLIGVLDASNGPDTYGDGI
jgi:hypothetical protein